MTSFPPNAILGYVFYQQLVHDVYPRFQKCRVSAILFWEDMFFFFENWPELYDDLSGSSLAPEPDEQRQVPPSSSDRLRHETERNEHREMESRGDMFGRYCDGVEEIHGAKYPSDERARLVFYFDTLFAR